jgi:hypothetical protein
MVSFGWSTILVARKPPSRPLRHASVRCDGRGYKKFHRRAAAGEWRDFQHPQNQSGPFAAPDGSADRMGSGAERETLLRPPQSLKTRSSVNGIGNSRNSRLATGTGSTERWQKRGELQAEPSWGRSGSQFSDFRSRFSDFGFELEHVGSS